MIDEMKLVIEQQAELIEKQDAVIKKLISIGKLFLREKAEHKELYDAIREAEDPALQAAKEVEKQFKDKLDEAGL